MKFTGLVTVFIWAACNVPKIATGSNYTYVPYIHPTHIAFNDTIKIKQATEKLDIKLEDERPRTKEESLLELNMNLQRLYFRAVDSATNRKIGKDSVYAMLLNVKDTVNATKRLMYSYKEIASRTLEITRRYNEIKDQQKNYNESINKMIYSGFALVVILQALSNILQAKYNKMLIRAKRPVYE